MVRAARFAVLLAGALALLTAAAAGASDDDEDPPYMIYIDPESGKYTTVDPLAAPDPRAQALPGPGDGAGTVAAPKSPWVLVTGAAAAVLLVLGGHRMRRRRRRLTTGKPAGRPA